MPISNYIRNLRQKVGHSLLLVPSATSITLNDQQEILLAHHAEVDIWVIPGGSLEPNEIPAEAAIRETWEETGILATPQRIVGVYGGPEFGITYSNKDQVSYVMTVFKCQAVGGSLKPDGEEMRAAQFVSPSQLKEFKLASWTQIVLHDFFQDPFCSHFKTSTWTPES